MEDTSDAPHRMASLTHSRPFAGSFRRPDFGHSFRRARRSLRSFSERIGRYRCLVSTSDADRAIQPIYVRQRPLIWLPLSHASIDAKFGTGDKAGFVAEEEDSSGRALVGACHAPERNGLDEHLPHLLGYRSQHVRSNRPRRDDIDADATRREFGPNLLVTSFCEIAAPVCSYLMKSCLNWAAPKKALQPRLPRPSPGSLGHLSSLTVA